MDTHQYISECLTNLVFFQIARKCDISSRDLNRDLNLNRNLKMNLNLKPPTYYYDGLAEQPSDIRWLRGPRTSQIELHKMTTTHFKPTILVNIRYYFMISGKNFIQQGAAVS